MNGIAKYFEAVQNELARVLATQAGKMRIAAEKIVDTEQNGGKTFIFGCTHAGIIAQEAFYRTGGLVIFNPIFAKNLTCDVRPVTKTSQTERIDGLGAKIADDAGVSSGDLLFIHSVSGRNAVSVDMAVRAREKGAYVVALTSLEYSKASSSRAACGLRLFEAADMTIDNCGVFGDAVVQIEGFEQKVAPTSSVTGCAVINAVTAEAVEIFIERGLVPPVFLSANIDGGDEFNKKIMEKYKNRINYL